MRHDDDMMQSPFEIDPVKFAELVAAFDEIAEEEGLTDDEEYSYDDDAWAYDEVDELTEWHDYDPYC